MPLKLIPPDPKRRTTNYSIRGTYLKKYVDRTTGTAEIKIARQALATTKAEIERLVYGKSALENAGTTFGKAALAYAKDGGEDKFLDALIKRLDKVDVAQIDQRMIDELAEELHPSLTNASRNRMVYTPISAVLRFAGVERSIRRPRNAQGTPRRHFLRPDEAKAFLEAAWRRHPRFAALCTVLLCCGCRLSEALEIQVRDVDLEARTINLPDTKNGEPQCLFLSSPAFRAVELALLEPIREGCRRPTEPRKSGSLFCLTKSGALYHLFNEVAKAAGIYVPDDVSFHLFRHTYGAWMRARGVPLEETGRWTSRAGAAAYSHYEITRAARAAEDFPVLSHDDRKSVENSGAGEVAPAITTTYVEMAGP